MGKPKQHKNRGGEMEEEDDRFKAVAFDPRFQRFPREKSKLTVDDRFKDMFENPEFQVGSTKDKRGKKGKKKLVDEARRYYRLEEEEPAVQEESDEDALRWARMRGLAGPSSSSSNSSESSGDDDDDAEEDNRLEDGVLDEDVEALYEDWGVGAYAANPNEDVPMLPDATKRLACVDLDWEHIKAVDILAVLQSFVPDGGSIVSVTVYPSDYGLEKMAEEKNSGPKQIWKSTIDEDGSESDLSDEDGALDAAKLRYYERSKLRWYYAIVVCSNVRTAEAIYNECDGMEYMKTANVFDLRFVPDEQSFKDRVVRETASHIPADYVAPVFQTKALQHTNVELTWDKVDDERKKTLSRKLKDDELKDEDFKTYLASASDSSDEEDIDTVPGEDHEDIKKRYQSLLLKDGITAERQGTKEWGMDEQSEDDEGNVPAGCVPDKSMELEVTFEQDLETLGEKLSMKAKEKKKKGTETVWEAYVRRRKEKKEEARRKGRINYHSSDEDDVDSDVEQASPPTNEVNNSANPFDDPFFTQNDGFKEEKQPKAAKKKHSKETVQDDDRQAELEMLLMDRESLKSAARKQKMVDQVQTKKLSKKERMKLAKLKKRAEREDGSDNEDLDAANQEYLNMKDPRFQDVFENPEFALDPTDPRFAKAGRGATKLVSEAARRRSTKKKNVPKQDLVPSQEEVTNRQNGSQTKPKADLKLMVASLKRKSATQSVRSQPKKPSKW
jgi:hypothetical protein